MVFFIITDIWHFLVVSSSISLYIILYHLFMSILYVHDSLYILEEIPTYKFILFPNFKIEKSIWLFGLNAFFSLLLIMINNVFLSYYIFHFFCFFLFFCLLFLLLLFVLYPLELLQLILIRLNHYKQIYQNNRVL